MIRRFLVVLGLVTASLVTTAPAQAVNEELSPTVRLDRAWIVGKGAAVEARYVVTCPINPLAGNGLMGMFTTVQQGAVTSTDFLEFTCTGNPDTVVVTNLVGTLGTSTGQVTITTKVRNCIYGGPEYDPEVGCFNPTTTDVIKIKSGAFAAESTEDRELGLTTTSARVTSTGEVRITQVLDCTSPNSVGLTTEVTQVSGGTARHGQAAYEDPVFGVYFECEGLREVSYLIPADVGQAFVTGDAVIESVLAQCFDGCDQAFDTRVVKLRK